MHVFDIFFSAAILVLVFLGIRRGFIEEVVRLAAIIVGFIGALAFYRNLAVHLSFLSHSTAITIVSFLMVFFSIAIGITCIGKLLKKIITFTMMGWLDRLCGACIGALKAFFLGWILVIIISSIPIPVVRFFFKDSRAYTFFVAISPTLKTKVIERVPSPSIALSRFPAVSDLGKKLLKIHPPADSLHGKEPPKKKPVPIEEKKR